MGRLIAFASLALRLVPPRTAGDTKELVFRTAPSVNKVRNFLRRTSLKCTIHPGVRSVDLEESMLPVHQAVTA